MYLKFYHVFNLGHGLLPETEPDKVFKLIKFTENIKNARRTSKGKIRCWIFTNRSGTTDTTGWWDIRKYLKEFLS